MPTLPWDHNRVTPRESLAESSGASAVSNPFGDLHEVGSDISHSTRPSRPLTPQADFITQAPSDTLPVAPGDKVQQYNEEKGQATLRATGKGNQSKPGFFRKIWVGSRSKPATLEAAGEDISEKTTQTASQQPSPSSKETESPTSEEIKLSFFQRQWVHLRSKYYQKDAPALVFPSPPDDEEKYCYVDMNRFWLMAWGIFSFCTLSTGMWLFLLATPVWAWYGVFAVLAQFYLVTSYGISTMGKSFKLDNHTELLRNHPITEDAPTVDVYLPVCREPLEILENTWQYIHQLRYPQGKLKVYVLDDGATTAVQELAFRNGFEYICRDDRPHLKKAGNLRYAFARTTSDYFAVFDADFCPRADFLLETVPHHLADPKAAIIQTPQYFRALKEQTWTEQGAGSVQEFFYRVVQTTRETWGAAICVGSNAVYRREALAAVGGTAEIAFSEDVHTGYHAVHRGWKVKYVPIVLGCGICPDTPRALFSQQMRWCMGSTTLLSNPEFYRSHLTKMQKFCYVTGFLYYSATALSVFMNPLPGPLLLWLRPDFFKYYNLFFAVPSVIYSVVIMRFWSRSNYTLNVQFTNTIMSYAYVNSIKDRIVGQKLNWAASGDLKAHKNNKYRNMRILAWAWTISHNTALITAVAYRLSTGFPWWQVIPIILLDAFNLYASHRFLLFTEA
ncbi:MAG: hypothetical protein Q9163_003817 [Psora crenata]